MQNLYSVNEISQMDFLDALDKLFFYDGRVYKVVSRFLESDTWTTVMSRDDISAKDKKKSYTVKNYEGVTLIGVRVKNL